MKKNIIAGGKEFEVVVQDDGSYEIYDKNGVLYQDGPKLHICEKCGAIIVHGWNGCTMYDTCSVCEPVVYKCKPRKMEPQGDYEGAILARQETAYDF